MVPDTVTYRNGADKVSGSTNTCRFVDDSRMNMMMIVILLLIIRVMMAVNL